MNYKKHIPIVLFTKLVLKLFRKSRTGSENIPEKGPFIAAANHSSYFDHFITAIEVYNRTGELPRFLAKKEHFDTFFQRQWHNYFNAIPIHRQAGGKKALKIAIQELKKGSTIFIYPEGTRTLDGNIQEARTGVARLAIAAKVPIIPIGIKGTFDILQKGKRIPKLKRYEVNIGKPILLTKFYSKANNKKALRLATTLVMKKIAVLAGKEYSFDKIKKQKK